MKQERRQNGRCNRVVRLKKPDGLLEARDFSHGFFTDYGRVGYIGMNSIEKACKSEFEKNGIEYDHYDVKEALESKSHYNIVNAYVKGYSDTREGMTSSSIRDFMIQYKQGLDAGDIEYKDAEFERVAEIFKIISGNSRLFNFRDESA